MKKLIFGLLIAITLISQASNALLWMSNKKLETAIAAQSQRCSGGLQVSYK